MQLGLLQLLNLDTDVCIFGLYTQTNYKVPLRDPGEWEEQKMEIISPKTRTRLHLGSNPSFCVVGKRPLSLAKTISSLYRHHVQHFYHFSLCFKQ